MDIDQLESFLYVVEEKNFSKAAERMFITQSTMSSRIHKLENTLGVALFTRKGKEITLSDFGERFLPHAKQCVNAMIAGKKSIEMEKQNYRTYIRIGVTYPFDTFVLPYLAAEIYKHSPELRIEIVRAQSPVEITKMIQLFQLDVGFVNKSDLLERQLNERFVYKDIFKDKMALVLKPSHPLVQSGHSTLSMISTYQFVMPRSVNSISQLIRKYFSSHNMELPEFVEINSADAIKYIVKTTNMLSFLPEMTIQDEITKGELAMMPITPKLPLFEMSMLYETHTPNMTMIDFISNKMRWITRNVHKK